jgi:hypothetical protein
MAQTTGCLTQTSIIQSINLKETQFLSTKFLLMATFCKILFAEGEKNDLTNLTHSIGLATKPTLQDGFRASRNNQSLPFRTNPLPAIRGDQKETVWVEFLYAAYMNMSVCRD